MIPVSFLGAPCCFLLKLNQSSSGWAWVEFGGYDDDDDDGEEGSGSWSGGISEVGYVGGPNWGSRER